MNARRLWAATACAIAAMLTLNPLPTQADTVGLAVLASPIYAPDLNNPQDCSRGSLSASKTDGSTFAKFDVLTVWTKEAGISYQGFRPIETTYMVTPSMYTGALPATLALRFDLCTIAVRVSPLPALVTVNVELSDGIRDLAKVAIRVPLSPRNEEAVAAAGVLSSCGVDESSPRFEENLPAAQTLVPSRSSGKAIVKGTLFRQGFVASGETISLHIEAPGNALKLGRRLGSTTTDSRGQFSFTFPMVRSGITIYQVYVGPRFDPIGPVPGPFREQTFILIADWSRGDGRLFMGLRDWVPAPTAACSAAVSAYLAVREGSTVRIFNDDRHPLAVYTAKKLTYGLRGKKTYSSYDTWDIKSGGRCYVSGYTTRTGKHVSGYFRSC